MVDDVLNLRFCFVPRAFDGAGHISCGEGGQGEGGDNEHQNAEADCSSEKFSFSVQGKRRSV